MSLYHGLQRDMEALRRQAVSSLPSVIYLPDRSNGESEPYDADDAARQAELDEDASWVEEELCAMANRLFSAPDPEPVLVPVLVTEVHVMVGVTQRVVFLPLR